MVKIHQLAAIILVVITILTVFTSCEKSKDDKADKKVYECDTCLMYLGEQFILYGSVPTDYGVIDSGERLSRGSFRGETLICDPETNVVNKVYIDKENQSILDLRIGMSRADAKSIISDCKIKETMLNGDDYKTESVVDKYNVVVTWRLSYEEIKKFGLYCLDVANPESEIYREDHGGKTANEKLENFMKSNGLVGTAAKIEVSLAENASE